ncbi:Cyclic di-GMP-binding protein precursor [Vibrio thalassae]|uniref:Cyclic di-GMP-binding protein n=1 Tax=Vibrio thalassae TaxID=1243014 RepID=A0A240EAP0_9VIBR|nr:cellulose biosynthesis cyclic di-GMP-binding regulatory protein BcsB [Vibrio thalassae]SNX45279.1 Cyclic di-GMP-binding protein precursor [Vibrio thalassae]
MKLIHTLSGLILSVTSMLSTSVWADFVDSSTKKISYTFSEIAGPSSITVKGSGGTAFLGFGSRLDQIITGGSLNLEFAPSPALRTRVSHLRIYLNEELMDVVDITRGDSTMLSKVITLDGRFFKNYNQIKFELIGRIDEECSDASDPALWWELGSASRITLDVRNIEVANELSLLPAPFFDSRDLKNVSIPVVLPQNFGTRNLHSAAVVASYFASQVKWREVSFPVYQQGEPEQHAVVLATNSQRPELIKDLPEITQPTIQMVTQPTMPGKKLLLVLGKDEEQLALAAKGLVAGSQLMSGEVAYVNSVTDVAPRKPYDAPNWLPTDRAVKFSELIEGNYQLESQGVELPPIRVSFTLPPDLFTWNANSVPMKLSYRYSPPLKGSKTSRLNISVNDRFIRAFPLDENKSEGDQDTWRVPILGSESFSARSSTQLPGFKISENNTLAFNFQIAKVSTGICEGVGPSIYYAAVDGDSTLDFSGFPHYIRMPDAQSFVSSGFPYSRMADLSETSVVITPEPSDKEVELLLNTVGFISKQTGLPAYQFQLTESWDEVSLAEKDILVVGVQAADKLSLTSASLAHVRSNESGRFIEATTVSEKPQSQGIANLSGRQATISANVRARGEFASIASFESPFTKQRTVTVLSARNDQSVPLLYGAMNARSALVNGSAIAITQYEITSHQVGDYYYVGTLPLFDLVWYHFSDRPMLMVAVALLLVVAFTMLMWRVLSRYAKRRLAATGVKQ